MYKIDLSSVDDELGFSSLFSIETDLNDLGILLEKSLKCEVGVTERTDDQAFRRLLANQENFRSAQEKFRTSKLWLMYMNMVDIMCTFIKA